MKFFTHVAAAVTMLFITVYVMLWAVIIGILPFFILKLMFRHY